MFPPSERRTGQLRGLAPHYLFPESSCLTAQTGMGLETFLRTLSSLSSPEIPVDHASLRLEQWPWSKNNLRHQHLNLNTGRKWNGSNGNCLPQWQCLLRPRSSGQSPYQGSSGHVHVQSKLSVSMESFVIICEFEPLVSMARILSYIINYMNPL